LLIFVLQKVVVNENRIEGYVLLQIPPGLRARIWDPEKKQQVLELGAESSGLTAKADYADRDVFRINYASGTLTRSETITFQDVFSPQGGFYNAWRSNSTVEIRGTGQQDRFPFDWYHVRELFSVDLVDPFCLVKVTDNNQQSTSPLLEGECPTGLDTWLSHSPVGHKIPLHIKVAAEPTMQGRKIKVNQYSSANVLNEVKVEVLIERDGLFKLYITIMSLIPLVLALVFLDMLLFSGKQHVNMIEAGPAIAASILAVLPIRSIIVPSEIQGINTVDIFLGIGLIAIAAALFTKYALEIWRGHSGEGIST